MPLANQLIYNLYRTINISELYNRLMQFSIVFNDFSDLPPVTRPLIMIKLNSSVLDSFSGSVQILSAVVILDA